MAWIANNHCGNVSSPDKCRGNWTYCENSEWQEDQHMSVKCLGKWPYNISQDTEITFDKSIRINAFVHDILGVSKQNVSTQMSTVRNVTAYIVMKSGFASPDGAFYSGDQISNTIFNLLFYIMLVK